MDLSYGTPLPVAEVKAAGDAWEVSGYASTFGNVDLGSDVVVHGAFDDWLKQWNKGLVKTRFLFSHDPSRILGTPVEMRADDKGLFVKAKISKTQLGQDVHTLLKDKALDSFSIGYIPTEVDFTEDGSTRKLVTMDLPEFSLVAMPMNEQAEVTGVKRRQLNTDVSFDQLISQIAGYMTIGVDEAEALLARRVADGRKFTDDHLDAIGLFRSTLEGCDQRLQALLAEPESEPVRTGTALGLRHDIARLRLRMAGVEL